MLVLAAPASVPAAAAAAAAASAAPSVIPGHTASVVSRFLPPPQQQSAVEASLQARQRAGEDGGERQTAASVPRGDFSSGGRFRQEDSQDAEAARAPPETDSDPEEVGSVGVPPSEDQGMGSGCGDDSGHGGQPQNPPPSNQVQGDGDERMDGQGGAAAGAAGVRYAYPLPVAANAQRAQDDRSNVGSDGDPEDREDASERAAGWEGKWVFWDSVDWTVEAWDDLDILTDRHIDPRLRPALAAVIEEIVDRLGDEDAIKAERAWKALAYFPSIFFCKD